LIFIVSFVIKSLSDDYKYRRNTCLDVRKLLKIQYDSSTKLIHIISKCKFYPINQFYKIGLNLKFIFFNIFVF